MTDTANANNFELSAAEEETILEFAEEDDSAIDPKSEIGDDTVSLESSITRYRYENGRRYHVYSDAEYWGPNDDPANDIQDLGHHLYLLTLDNQLYLAPIQNPERILDVGTGTGIWAIDIADEFPRAIVTGTDLSPIQPSFVPPNCFFEIDDATLDWTFPEDHFDFIHVREMFGSVGDWDEFFRQAFLHTKPGGYVEILEHSVQPRSDDDSVGPDHFYTRWGDTVVEMGEKRGKSFTVWRETKERLERAGFADLVETRMKWPMNDWSSDPKMRLLGIWNRLRLDKGIEGYMLRLLTTVGEWSYNEVQIFLAQMRKAMSDRTAHAYLELNIVYGRKPES